MFMKRMLMILLAALTLLPLSSIAGVYDGIWQDATTPGRYTVFYHDALNNIFAIHLLYAPPATGPAVIGGSWDSTATGTINANIATMTNNAVNALGLPKTRAVIITFTSPTTATVVLQSCTGAGCAAAEVPGFTNNLTRLY